jgi:hypothetical protein
MQYSRSADAVIRVYDSAGNALKRTSIKAISKSGEVIAVDRIHRPQRRLV